MSYALYRSTVFSTLKVQYGWSGMIPDGCDDTVWEQKIKNCVINNECLHAVALWIVDDINDHGGSFLERIDGKPNLRTPTQKINNFIKNELFPVYKPSSKVRSKAYRDMWKLIYQAGRNSKNHGHELYYVIKYMRRNAISKTNKDIVNSMDILLMVEHAIDALWNINPDELSITNRLISYKLKSHQYDINTDDFDNGLPF